MKNNIDILFERLRIEYDIRDQLWIDVRKAVDEIGILLVHNVIWNWLYEPTVAPAIEQLKDTPATIERTIVKLEKKSETLERQKDSDNDLSSLAKELWKKIIWNSKLCITKLIQNQRKLVKSVRLGWWTGVCRQRV